MTAIFFLLAGCLFLVGLCRLCISVCATGQSIMGFLATTPHSCSSFQIATYSPAGYEPGFHAAFKTTQNFPAENSKHSRYTMLV